MSVKTLEDLGYVQDEYYASTDSDTGVYINDSVDTEVVIEVKRVRVEDSGGSSRTIDLELFKAIENTMKELGRW